MRSEEIAALWYGALLLLVAIAFMAHRLWVGL
jgi:hypothetical protein